MFYEICKFYINVLNISIASSFILIIKEWILSGHVAFLGFRFLII